MTPGSSIAKRWEDEIAGRYNPSKGRWTLRRIVKQAIKDVGGEIDIETLVRHLKNLGYYDPSVARILSTLDLDILVDSDTGHLRLSN